MRPAPTRLGMIVAATALLLLPATVASARSAHSPTAQDHAAQREALRNACRSALHETTDPAARAAIAADCRARKRALESRGRTAGTPTTEPAARTDRARTGRR